MKNHNLQLDISIAGVNLNICIQNGLENIYRLFSLFTKTCASNDKMTINIFHSADNNVSLSRDKNCLNISGHDIDNLNDPFNLIGILQATFRFVSFHSCKNGIVLLHGSSSVYRDRAICFLDDNNGSIKSASSIECSLVSGEYIGDEFCFLDTKTMLVYSYPLIPIHFRPIVKDHFRIRHKLKFENRKYENSQAGYFAPPESIFKFRDKVELGSFVYVKLDKNKTCLQSLSLKAEKENLVYASLGTHMIKLIHPNLDRMSFCNKTDKFKKIECNSSNLKQIVSNQIPKVYIEKIIDNVIFIKVESNSLCEANQQLLKKLDILFDTDKFEKIS